MRFLIFALAVVAAFILLGVFYVGSEASVAEADWLFSWLKTFLLSGLALLALAGAGYFVAQGQSAGQLFQRLAVVILATSALVVLLLFIAFASSLEVGLGRHDF